MLLYIAGSYYPDQFPSRYASAGTLPQDDDEDEEYHGNERLDLQSHPPVVFPSDIVQNRQAQVAKQPSNRSQNGAMPNNRRPKKLKVNVFYYSILFWLCLEKSHSDHHIHVTFWLPAHAWVFFTLLATHLLCIVIILVVVPNIISLSPLTCMVTIDSDVTDSQYEWE